MSLPYGTRVVVSGEPYEGQHGQIVPPTNAADLNNWPVWVLLDGRDGPAGFKETEVRTTPPDCPDLPPHGSG